jgi:hypothetical protein
MVAVMIQVMFDWSRNAHVPLSLIVGGANWVTRKLPIDNLLSVDIEIEAGTIDAITAAGAFSKRRVGTAQDFPVSQ